MSAVNHHMAIGNDGKIKYLTTLPSSVNKWDPLIRNALITNIINGYKPDVIIYNGKSIAFDSNPQVYRAKITALIS